MKYFLVVLRKYKSNANSVTDLLYIIFSYLAERARDRSFSFQTFSFADVQNVLGAWI